MRIEKSLISVFYRKLPLSFIAFCLFHASLKGQDSIKYNRQQRIALKGKIVMPDTIIKNGWILIEGRIISKILPGDVSAKVFPPNTLMVDTRGIIFPGLVDVHNHLAYNVFPEWSVGRIKFNNRYEWRFHLPSFNKKINDPFDSLKYDFACHFNTYGEIRALVGGTTSVVAGRPACSNNMIRNLSDENQADQRNIDYLIDIRNHDPGGDPADVEDRIKTVREDLEEGKLDAFFIHLAEGKKKDLITRQEFTFLKAKGLLTSKTAIIHGISLGPVEFKAMYDSGASLVWSPRSNIQLYGETADIIAAKRSRIRIALAPDWAISGSVSLIEELRFAQQWNKIHLKQILSNKELVEMVTSIPASIAGMGDKIGSIREGYLADLLVINSNHADTYESLIQSNIHDIRLVIVNGSPLYGKQDLMEKFWAPDLLDTLLNSNPAMVIKRPLNEFSSFKVLRNELRTALDSHQVDLVPVFQIKSRNATSLPKLQSQKGP